MSDLLNSLYTKEELELFTEEQKLEEIDKLMNLNKLTKPVCIDPNETKEMDRLLKIANSVFNTPVTLHNPNSSINENVSPSNILKNFYTEEELSLFTDEQKYEEIQRLTENRTSVNRPVVDTNEKNEMNRLLKIMNGQSEIKNNLLNEAKISAPVREAINIKHKNNKIIYADKLEIQIKTKNNLKRFDIIDRDGNIVANDLYLASAASCILKYVNLNKSLLSNEIRNIIVLEESYAKYFEEALMYKKLLNTNKNPEKKIIFQNNYEKCLHNAKMYKNKIDEIKDSLP